MFEHNLDIFIANLRIQGYCVQTLDTFWESVRFLEIFLATFWTSVQVLDFLFATLWTIIRILDADLVTFWTSLLSLDTFWLNVGQVSKFSTLFGHILNIYLMFGHSLGTVWTLLVQNVSVLTSFKSTHFHLSHNTHHQYQQQILNSE